MRTLLLAKTAKYRKNSDRGLVLICCFATVTKNNKEPLGAPGKKLDLKPTQRLNFLLTNTLQKPKNDFFKLVKWHNVPKMEKRISLRLKHTTRQCRNGCALKTRRNIFEDRLIKNNH